MTCEAAHDYHDHRQGHQSNNVVARAILDAKNDLEDRFLPSKYVVFPAFLAPAILERMASEHCVEIRRKEEEGEGRREGGGRILFLFFLLFFFYLLLLFLLLFILQRSKEEADNRTIARPLNTSVSNLHHQDY